MKVVIVGGGFCGSILAKKLDHHPTIETTLVDKNEFFEYYPSLPKLLTQPSLKNKITISYDTFLSNAELINDTIEYISPDYVRLGNKKIDFDKLVISTGADYPIKLDNTKNIYKVNSVANALSLSKELQPSKHVLIIGGGLIGVEVCAELATNTSKKLTLVHGHDRLLERNPKKASEYAAEFLENYGVELIFNDKVVDNKNKFMTEKDRIIDADIAVWAAGLGFDRSFFKNFEDEVFSENWGLSVDKKLRLSGYKNIYVGGDVTSIDEEKTGHNADVHGKHINKNLRRQNSGKELLNYKHKGAPMVISLGRNDGIMIFKDKILKSKVPSITKKLLEKGALERLRF